MVIWLYFEGWTERWPFKMFTISCSNAPHYKLTVVCIGVRMTRCSKFVLVHVPLLPIYGFRWSWDMKLQYTLYVCHYSGLRFCQFSLSLLLSLNLCELWLIGFLSTCARESMFTRFISLYQTNRCQNIQQRQRDNVRHFDSPFSHFTNSH